jgi:hypothetical protein
LLGDKNATYLCSKIISTSTQFFVRTKRSVNQGVGMYSAFLCIGELLRNGGYKICLFFVHI